jgi:hypothetical protein
VGELEEGKYKFKSLEFTFTSVQEGSGLKVGDVATVTNGGFEFLDQKMDQNKDGMNDKTGEALPLGLFGSWQQQGQKTHAIKPWVSQEAKKSDQSPNVDLAGFTVAMEGTIDGVIHYLVVSAAGSNIRGSLRKKHSATSVLREDPKEITSAIEGTWDQNTKQANIEAENGKKLSGILTRNGGKASFVGDGFSLKNNERTQPLTASAVIITDEAVKPKTKNYTLEGVR